MDKKEQNIRPNYKQIFSDILQEKYPEKKFMFSDILNKKELSSLDVIDLNNKIFNNQSEIECKYHSYQKTDILEILDFQKKHQLNNTQLAKHFKISRNSVAKWKKIFM